MSVLPGIEVLIQNDFAPLSGKRIGLMTNSAAVDVKLRPTYLAIANSRSVKLGALFAPEHGFLGAARDGEHIDTTTDPRTGVRINSLYGEQYLPSAEMLAGLDAVVCDIQDVGVRFYTFLWTISYILEAAGAAGVEVVILDRPNPLGGKRVFGASFDVHLSSFVGRFPIPTCYGMTIGELSQMINALWNPAPAHLTVVECKGWTRAQSWAETGLLWVSPSPNMPHISTVIQYPGACLVEGTNLSEGRGTPLPFEVVGAPWIDSIQLSACLNEKVLLGVLFRPHTFRPTSGKWAGEYCSGVQVHVLDKQTFDAIDTWLTVIATIKARYADRFEWLPAHQGVFHFDRLIGSEHVRQRIDVNEPLDDLQMAWRNFCGQFSEQREPFLLYD